MSNIDTISRLVHDHLFLNSQKLSKYKASEGYETNRPIEVESIFMHT